MRWLAIAKRDDIVPIPGTKTPENILKRIVAAESVQLDISRTA